MVGVPPSCALLGGFAIGTHVLLPWQHMRLMRNVNKNANTHCMAGYFCYTFGAESDDIHSNPQPSRLCHLICICQAISVMCRMIRSSWTVGAFM